MDDTLEKPKSQTQNILSLDQSTSPVIPDRSMLIEFDNSKSKGDVIRSMNETFSTVKENPILETDGDHRDDHNIETLTEVQVG